jgi:hypothetical protein
MKIQALGCGCKRSTANYEAVVEAAKELGITDEVEFYKDSDGIMAMGIMSTPALVIDNKIYCDGPCSHGGASQRAFAESPIWQRLLVREITHSFSFHSENSSFFEKLGQAFENRFWFEGALIQSFKLNQMEWK